MNFSFLIRWIRLTIILWTIKQLIIVLWQNKWKLAGLFLLYLGYYYFFTDGPVRDRAVAAFQRDKVAIMNVTAQADHDSIRMVRTVQADISNQAQAGIQDIYLECSYTSPKTPTEGERTWVQSERYVGKVDAGTKQRITFDLDRKGYLMGANANSFVCSPKYTVVQQEILKAENAKIDDMATQVDVHVTTGQEKKAENRYRLTVNGSITNNSKKDIGEIRLACTAVRDIYGKKAYPSPTFKVRVSPGETKSFYGPVGWDENTEKDGFVSSSCYVDKVW
ncbi:hypothetical protein ILT44_27725 [Microvirga sp. BT689]|uniref:hypothetical protein n=1 Tax=Microvirga arvi TaxID=2778731 RepID=UPI0019523EA6|nr:hypothetical protein [Microvirga arvi]MBM6583994.1 hypothetical protein [Microvirga arvi]